MVKNKIKLFAVTVLATQGLSLAVPAVAEVNPFQPAVVSAEEVVVAEQYTIAEDSPYDGEINLTGGSAKISFKESAKISAEKGRVIIEKGGNFKITGAATGLQIVIADSVDAPITLELEDVTLSHTNAPIVAKTSSEVTLKLKGQNKFNDGEANSEEAVIVGNSMTITADGDATLMLTGKKAGLFDGSFAFDKGNGSLRVWGFMTKAVDGRLPFGGTDVPYQKLDGKIGDKIAVLSTESSQSKDEVQAPNNFATVFYGQIGVFDDNYKIVNTSAKVEEETNKDQITPKQEDTNTNTNNTTTNNTTTNNTNQTTETKQEEVKTATVKTASGIEFVVTETSTNVFSVTGQVPLIHIGQAVTLIDKDDNAYEFDVNQETGQFDFELSGDLVDKLLGKELKLVYGDVTENVTLPRPGSTSTQQGSTTNTTNSNSVSDLPKTGEKSSAGLVLTGLLAVGAGLAGLFFLNKKNKPTENK